MAFKPAERNSIEAADWIEFKALCSPSLEFSYEDVRTYIDSDGTLSTEEDKNDVAPHEYSEQLIASISIEIKRRIYLSQRTYPFNLSNGILKAKLEATYTPYIFCLLVTSLEYDPKDKTPSKLFEHLVRETTAVYLDGDSARFGWPRDTMPVGIHDAIDQLAELTGNRKRSYGFPTNATDKDLGLDVVAWKNFADKYWGKVELYIQCATGEHWENKTGDPNLEKWNDILTWPFRPLRGFAIPHVIPYSEWRRKTHGILLIDRLRISSTLKSKILPEQEFGWWDWCQERIQEGKQRED